MTTDSVASFYRCPYCGNAIHTANIYGCPNVKAVEYFPDGTLKRVELVREDGSRPFADRFRRDVTAR